MGKKKKGAVCNNPVAMARAAGPPPVTGPTIRDYLGRDRPSLEEAAGIIASQQKRKESGALAAYEEQLNDSYKLELKERRERLLGAGSSHRSRSKDKKKKSKKSKKHSHKERRRSRSRSPHSTTFSRHSDTKQDSTGQHSVKKKRSRKHARHRSESVSSSSENSSDDIDSPRS